MGKNGVNYAVGWFNDRVEIRFKDPNAKKEAAQINPPAPADPKERRSTNYYPDTVTKYSPDTYGYGDYYPVKPGKRSDERTKPYSYDYTVLDRPAAKRANNTTGWVTTGYRDVWDPVSHDYFVPDKPTGKRSDANGWYAASYIDSYPAQKR
jgi:hypothetical protein